MIRPISVVEAHEPVEFGGQLRILDRVPARHSFLGNKNERRHKNNCKFTERYKRLLG